MASKIPKLTARVYGGIVNLKTKEEIDLDGDKLDVAIYKLRMLDGTRYGVHWEYAGDLTAEDSDACIYVSEYDDSFGGENAVSDFLFKHGVDHAVVKKPDPERLRISGLVPNDRFRIVNENMDPPMVQHHVLVKLDADHFGYAARPPGASEIRIKVSNPNQLVERVSQ